MTEQRPENGGDPGWPDDWREDDWPDQVDQPPGNHVPFMGFGSARRGRRTLALALTAVIAGGAGSGAVYLYKHAVAGSTPPAAAASPRGPAGSAQGGRTVTGVMMLGRVLRVGRGSVTVGGGPGPAISGRVTSATRFTGSARSLAQVRIGDTVAVQIIMSGGLATVVSLQDPGSQP
jgi:hypothetical protein